MQTFTPATRLSRAVEGQALRNRGNRSVRCQCLIDEAALGELRCRRSLGARADEGEPIMTLFGFHCAAPVVGAARIAVCPVCPCSRARSARRPGLSR